MDNPNFKLLKKKEYLGYFGVILIPFVTFLLGLTVGFNQAKHEASLPYERTRASVVTNGNQNGGITLSANGKNIDLSLFWKVWDTLGNMYIDTSRLSEQTMVYGAIKGMVSALNDPYTLFMTPKETEDFRNTLSGDLEGIGAELSIKENRLVVISPLKDSPAEKAGLKPGDEVVKIDDVSTSSLSLAEAVTKIRGKKGTTVKLTILRGSTEKPMDLFIERREIKVPSISWAMKEDSIAYISINQFGDDTTKEFSDAVNQILLKKPKGIILDLRFNGGGYLEGAVDIVSEFIEDGVVTTIKKRETQDQAAEEVQKVKGHARFLNQPLVVLINAGSASASEIVAGALKDHKRATLLGEKSFGKGTVQEFQPLSDGSSLRITIAQWFTPNHTNVTEVGITPDIEVKEPDTASDQDVQLTKAIEEIKKELQK